MAINFPPGTERATPENGPQNGPYTLAWAGDGKWADSSLWKWHYRSDGETICRPGSTHYQTFLPAHYWKVADKLPIGANKCQLCDRAGAPW